MEGKNLGKMMENNRNGDVGGFVFAGILTVSSLFIIAIALFTSGLSWDLLFLLPLIVIIFIPWYFTIKGHKNNNSIEKHIKDGTVIIKKATIKEIKEHRGDGFQDHYLIIVATDGS